MEITDGLTDTISRHNQPTQDDSSRRARDRAEDIHVTAHLIGHVDNGLLHAEIVVDILVQHRDRAPVDGLDDRRMVWRAKYHPIAKTDKLRIVELKNVSGERLIQGNDFAEHVAVRRFGAGIFQGFGPQSPALSIANLFADVRHGKFEDLGVQIGGIRRSRTRLVGGRIRGGTCPSAPTARSQR